MITVRQLLNVKGHAVWSIAPTATVYQAVASMAEKGVGALLVLDEEHLAGIISERDYTRKIVLKDRSSRKTTVLEIMTSKVICVRPDQTIDECMQLMADHCIRHLPVLDQEQVVGMLSIKDVLKGIISEKDYLIHQLENYITGTG